MSGLAVVLHRDGRPVDRGTVEAMLDAVSYRGPDGTAARLFGPVGFGHARMAMNPEDERERQPLISHRTGCAVIADVRLDNRDDLLARLPEPQSGPVGDAGLILRAYEAWGVDAVERLLGDFAFAIWDPRQRRLLCARDTSGQRSLFYRVDPRTFAAASEIQQLLQDPSVPIIPDEQRIRDFLVPLNVFRNEKDQAATFYAGIRALPAGHILVMGNRGTQVRCYWELEPPAAIRYRADDEYVEHYLSLFAEVVRARLRSAHPVGVLLSGGLDSSSIVGVARQLHQDGRVDCSRLRTFSLLFDSLDCDERDLIGEIERACAFEAQYRSVRPSGSQFEHEPRGFRESPNMGVREQRDALCEAAHRAGVRALLTGEVADGCVSGSPLVFDSLLRHGEVRALLHRLRAYRRTSDGPLVKDLILYCLAPLLPIRLQSHLVGAYLRWLFHRERWGLLPHWMPAPLREELSARHLQLSLQAERRRQFSNQTLHWEYGELYPPEIVRHPAPWPIEFWRPFADRRLHEFLLAIPPEQKFRPAPDSDEFYAGSKWLVRRALHGILPERVRTRTHKTVFDSVFEGEIARNWPAYERAFGPGSRSEIATRGYVDRSAFWSRLQQLRSGLAGGDARYVLRLVELESWLCGLALPRARLITVPPPRVGRLSSATPDGSGRQGAIAIV
jgi:asparagine synthase (glutamine-hydrolysing)